MKSMHSISARLLLCGLVVGGCTERPADDVVAGSVPDTMHATSGHADTAHAEPSHAEPTADPWVRAAGAIRHLPLDSFPDVPQWARATFAERGCAVAQAFYPDTPHNVVSGEFAHAGQVDWAALCGRGDSTRIVVAWGGAAHCPVPLAGAPNADYLQGIGNDEFGFSRAIRALPNESVRTLAEEFGGPAPPSTDHDGIDDMFVEKASVVRYCHDGRWHKLAGLD